MRSKIFKSPKRRVNLVYPRIALAFVVFGLVLVGAVLPADKPAQAATGINKTINYQGRLLNAVGAVVADGTYNMEFKIYQDGPGNVAGDTGGTPMWTEDWVYGPGSGVGWADRRVTVKNGYFSVALGTICSMAATTCTANNGNAQTNTVVDFNQDTLWLSVNVGNTTTAATFAGATGDGEMLPMKRMSAAPYALQAANANLLGGIAASGFAQLGASQTFTAANIFQPTANVTGLVVKQNSNVSPTADIFNTQTFNGTNAIQVTGPALNEAAVTIQSVGATRDLTLQSGSGTVKLGSSTALNANAALTISSGAVTSNSNLTVNANGTGTLALDTTGAGTVNVATASETVLGLGNNSSAVTIASNATLNVGNNGVNKTINVGVTGATANTTAVNIATSTGAAQTINIGGTNTTSGTSNSGTVVSFQGGATGLKVANAGITAQTYTNSTAAFQLQNAIGSIALGVDTTPLNTIINNGSVEGTDNSNWANKSGTGTPTRDNAQAFIGSWAEKVVLGTAIGDSVKYTPSPVLTAGTYALSFEIRQTAGTAFGANLAVGWNNGASDSNCTLSPTSTIQPIPTTGWARYTCTFTGSTGATSHLYWKQTDAPGSARTFYIDAVQLELATTAKPYDEGNVAINSIINSPVALENTSDSTTAFRIQNAAGDTSLFIADTLNNTIALQELGSQSANILEVRDGSSNVIAGVESTGAIFSAPFGATIPANARLFAQPNGASSTAIIARASFTGPATGDIFDAQDSTGANTMFAIGPTGQTTIKPTGSATNALQVQNASVTVLNVDAANQQLAVRSLADAASLGSELVTSQAFNTANWTTCNGGAGGWTGTATTTTHNTGNTVACSAAAGNFTVTSGTTYQVTYQLASNTTATNTVAVSMGGVSAPAIGQTGTNTQSFVITTVSTAALTFTPTTSFNGVISSVSVKVLTTYGSTLAVNNGSDNTVALEVRTGGSGKFNTAIGANALRSNISGSDNTVLGYDALRVNTTGNQNTAVGSLALTRNTAGIQNTALGYGALTKNTTGSWNNALGYLALSANTTGGDNSAIGYQALQANTAGSTNIAMGTQALNANTTGSNNTGLGVSALFNSVTGSLNTALGSNAGTQLSSGSNNTFVGAQAGGIDTDTFTTSNNLTNATAIGYQAVVQNSSTLVLGGTGGQAVNVGIGTTVPINTLSVSPVHYSAGTAGTGGVSSATITGVGTAWNTAGNVSKGDEIIFADGQATTVTGITSDTSITVFGAVTEATGSKYRIHYMGLQVTSAGRVGVGTSTPSAAFQVQDQVSAISILTGDAVNKQVLVGSSTTDANAVLLVLDSYSQSADPTGVDGAMYYNSATQSFRCRTNGAWVSCLGGMRYSQTNQGSRSGNLPPTGDTIANSTSQIDFTDLYSVPANDCTAGRVYRVTAGGVYSTAASGTSIKFHLRLFWGAPFISDLDGGNALVQLPNFNESNENWSFEATVTCYTNFAGSTTVESRGSVAFGDSPHGGNSVIGVSSVTAPSITTNSSQSLGLDWQWVAASASNTVTMRNFTVEAIGP